MSQKTSLVILSGGDMRECFRDGDYFVHVLNSNWRVHKSDPLILEVHELS